MNSKLNDYFLKFNTIDTYKTRESEILYFNNTELTSGESKTDLEMI